MSDPYAEDVSPQSTVQTDGLGHGGSKEILNRRSAEVSTFFEYKGCLHDNNIVHTECLPGVDESLDSFTLFWNVIKEPP